MWWKSPFVIFKKHALSPFVWYISVSENGFYGKLLNNNRFSPIIKLKVINQMGLYNLSAEVTSAVGNWLLIYFSRVLKDVNTFWNMYYCLIPNRSGAFWICGVIIGQGTLSQYTRTGIPGKQSRHGLNNVLWSFKHLLPQTWLTFTMNMVLNVSVSVCEKHKMQN